MDDYTTVSYISVVRVHERTAKLEARAMHDSWDTTSLGTVSCKGWLTQSKDQMLLSHRDLVAIVGKFSDAILLSTNQIFNSLGQPKWTFWAVLLIWRCLINSNSNTINITKYVRFVENQY